MASDVTPCTSSIRLNQDLLDSIPFIDDEETDDLYLSSLHSGGYGSGWYYGSGLSGTHYESRLPASQNMSNYSLASTLRGDVDGTQIPNVNSPGSTIKTMDNDSLSEESKSGYNNTQPTRQYTQSNGISSADEMYEQVMRHRRPSSAPTTPTDNEFENMTELRLTQSYSPTEYRVYKSIKDYREDEKKRLQELEKELGVDIESTSSSLSTLYLEPTIRHGKIVKGLKKRFSSNKRSSKRHSATFSLLCSNNTDKEDMADIYAPSTENPEQVRKKSSWGKLSTVMNVVSIRPKVKTKKHAFLLIDLPVDRRKFWYESDKKTRQMQYENFCKLYPSLNSDEVTRHSVDTFEQLKECVKSFYDKESQRAVIAVIVFNGHGSVNGIKFNQDNPAPLDDVISEINKLHLRNKQQNKLPHLVQIVFGQCHSHNYEEPADHSIQVVSFTNAYQLKTQTTIKLDDFGKNPIDSKHTQLNEHADKIKDRESVFSEIRSRGQSEVSMMEI